MNLRVVLNNRGGRVANLAKAGEPLTGCVILDQARVLCVKHIQAHVLGRGVVVGPRHKHQPGLLRLVRESDVGLANCANGSYTYSMLDDNMCILNEEIYCYDTKTLLGNTEVGSCELLEPGARSISFSFLMPAMCPSSFHGSRGSIEYRLIVTVTLASGSTRVKTIPFFLYKELDIRHCAIIPSTLTYPPTQTNNCFLQPTLREKTRLPSSARTYESLSQISHFWQGPVNLKQPLPPLARIYMQDGNATDIYKLFRFIVSGRHVVPGERVTGYLVIDQTAVQLRLLEKVHAKQPFSLRRLLCTKQSPEHKLLQALMKYLRNEVSSDDHEGLYFVIRQSVLYFDTDRKVACTEERDLHAGKMTFQVSALDTYETSNCQYINQFDPLARLTLTNSCRVPPVAPSSGNDCSCITVSYRLGVAVRERCARGKRATVQDDGTELLQFNATDDPDDSICGPLLFTIPLVVGTEAAHEEIGFYRSLPGDTVPQYVVQSTSEKAEESSPCPIYRCYFSRGAKFDDSAPQTPDSHYYHRPIRYRGASEPTIANLAESIMSEKRIFQVSPVPITAKERSRREFASEVISSHLKNVTLTDKSDAEC